MHFKGWSSGKIIWKFKKYTSESIGGVLMLGPYTSSPK